MTFYVQCRRISALMYYILTVQFLWAYLSGSCHIIQSIYTKIRGLREFFRVQFSLCAFYSLQSQKSREKKFTAIHRVESGFSGLFKMADAKIQKFHENLKIFNFWTKSKCDTSIGMFLGSRNSFLVLFFGFDKNYAK